MKLREYQKNIIEKVNEFVKTDEQEFVVKLYGGLGKTFLMPRISEQLKNQGYRVLVLSDISQLINQLEEHFNNMSLNVSKIVSNNKNTSVGSITLAMEQTIYNRLKKLNIDQSYTYVILYDEAHKRRYGQRFIEIVNAFNRKKLIGFSATPFDMRGIKMFLNIYEPISYKEAENKGYITKAKYFIPKVVQTLDFDSIDKSVGSDYTASDIRKLYGTNEFKSWFGSFIDKLDLTKRQTLIFVSNIQMAEDIYSSLRIDYQVITDVVHSKKSKNENDFAIDEFKKGNKKILISVTSLTTGFDAPNVNTIVSLRPTKSIPLLHQKIMRGSRLCKNKNYFEYYDITNNLLNFGIPEQFRCFDTENQAKRELAKETLISKKLTYDKNDIVEINEDILHDFEIELEELQAEKQYHLMDIEKLRLKFDLSESCEELILIGNEVARRYNVKTYSEDYLVGSVATEMEFYLDKLDKEYNKRKSTLKAYKTRIRNIIRNNGKLASMKYFPKWFYEIVQEKYGIRSL